MKKTLLTLFLSGIFGVAFAQEAPNNSFVAFVHGGFGILPDKTSGLTSTSKSYEKTLSSGASWNIQAYFQHKKLITGLLYSGYASSGKLEYTSDKILTTYLAPQLGMNIPIGEQFAIAFNGGIGGMWYVNNSIVYEKDRKVTGNTVGINLGLKGIYNFSKHFGLSLEALAVSANLSSTNVNYHNEDFKVQYSEFHLNQLAFSLGLKYSL